MILDVRTMGIISAATPLMLGLTLLMYLQRRKVYAGFGRWVLANFGLSTGYLFVSLRDFIPEFLSIVVGNVLVHYSVILIYEGIEEFYGRPAFSQWNYWILGSYVMLQSYFTYFDADINARVILSSLVLSILILRAGARLLLVSIPQLTATSRSAAYLFLGTALFPLVRAMFALSQPEPINFFSDPVNSWFSVVFIVSLVGWTFFFFFLNSARLELELETARDELKLIASTDSLTGLYNRRHFDEHAQVEFQRAKRYSSNLCFLLLDMDGFKSINDEYGHAAGDQVLLTVAAQLRGTVRSSDMLARLGGDEFVVMVLYANHKQVHAVAERIRKTIEETSVPVDSQDLKIRLSIGAACVGPDDVDISTTLKRADRALYQAKLQGRNRIVEA